MIDTKVIEQRKLCNILPAADIPYDSRGGHKISVKDTEIFEVTRRSYLPIATTISGLSLKHQSNRNSDDYLESHQNLQTGKLAKCVNLVIGHDIFHNTLSEHPFKKISAVSSQALV